MKLLAFVWLRNFCYALINESLGMLIG